MFETSFRALFEIETERVIRYLLGDFTGHVLVMTYFFVFDSELFLHFLETHVHRLDLWLVHSLHFPLRFINIVTILQSLFNGIKLGANISDFTGQGAILLCGREAILELVQQLLQFVIFFIES